MVCWSIICYSWIQLYVHRSGRTARAHKEGLSVMLVGPEDLKSFRNICKTLSRGGDDVIDFCSCGKYCVCVCVCVCACVRVYDIKKTP